MRDAFSVLYHVMLYVLLFLIGILLFGSIVYASVSLAPWAPTSRKDLMLIKKLADLKHGEKWVEV